METSQGIEQYSKQISDNVEKSKNYILKKEKKFKLVDVACDQLQTMIPSQLRKYPCQTYSINTKKQERKKIPIKIEAYALISFIKQDNKDKILKALEKGFSFMTEQQLNQKKLQGMKEVIGAYETKRDAYSSGQHQLKEKLEMILYFIESAQKFDQTYKEIIITEENYEECMKKRLEKLENALEINIVLKLNQLNFKQINYLGKKMINHQSIFILIDMQEKEKKSKNSRKDREICFYSNRNQLQKQIISLGLVSFNSDNPNSFTTSSAEQVISLVVLMNIQHRINCYLLPQDQQNQNYNKIVYLIDSFFFDELLGEIKDNMKDINIIQEMILDITSGKKKLIKWKEYSELEEMFQKRLIIDIEHKPVNGISISTLKPNEYKEIQKFDCFINDQEIKNGKQSFLIEFKRLQDEIQQDQNNLSESLNKALLISRSNLVNQKPYTFMNERKEVLQIKLNSQQACENNLKSKFQFFSDIVIISLVWLCWENYDFYQSLKTIVKNYQSRNQADSNNQLFNVSNPKELLAALHKLRQFDSFKSFESSKEYADVFGKIGWFLIEILPQNKPLENFEQPIVINEEISQLLEQDTRDLMQEVQRKLMVTIDIMQPKDKSWYNYFLEENIDIQVDIQCLKNNESRANGYFMSIYFQITDREDTCELKNAQKLYDSIIFKGQQNDLNHKNGASSSNNQQVIAPYQYIVYQNQWQEFNQQDQYDQVSQQQNLIQQKAQDSGNLPEALCEHSDLYYFVKDECHIISLFYLMNMKHAIRLKENAEDIQGYQQSTRSLIQNFIFRLIDNKIRESKKVFFKQENLQWYQDFCNDLMDSINERIKVLKLETQYILLSKNKDGNYDILPGQQYSVKVKPIENSSNYFMEFSYYSPIKDLQMQRSYCVVCKLRIATVLIKQMCQFCFVKEIQNNF